VGGAGDRAERIGGGAAAGSASGGVAGNDAKGIATRDATVDDGWDALGWSGCGGRVGERDLVGTASSLVGADSRDDGFAAIWLHVGCVEQEMSVGGVRHREIGLEASEHSQE